jgi:DNA-binding NarL/FixJ family response regulator
MSAPRVLLADDHVPLLGAYSKLLSPEYEIVDLVRDGRALVETALREKPDVIVLDVSMPVLNGFEAAREIRARLPDTKLIFLTMFEDRGLLDAAFQAGASGFVLKHNVATELLVAVTQVIKGHQYVTPHLPDAESPAENA